MDFNVYEKGVLDYLDSTQRNYFSELLGEKLFNKITKLVGHLGYKGYDDFIKQNYVVFYHSLNNPREIYNSDYCKRVEILVENVKNAKFYQLSPLIKYFFVWRNLKYFDEVLAKFFSEIVTQQNNLEAANFIVNGSKKQLAFQKIIGKKPRQKDNYIIAGMSDLIDLHFPIQSSIPLFCASINGSLINEVSISLKNRGYIESIEQFQFLFIISTEENSSDFKIDWNGTVGTLLYLFLLLIELQILETKEYFTINSKILIFTTNKRKISKATVKVEKNRIRKADNLKNYALNAKNHNYSAIFEMISKLVELKK